jgi:hypothetical protein
MLKPLNAGRAWLTIPVAGFALRAPTPCAKIQRQDLAGDQNAGGDEV